MNLSESDVALLELLTTGTPMVIDLDRHSGAYAAYVRLCDAGQLCIMTLIRSGAFRVQLTDKGRDLLTNLGRS